MAADVLTPVETPLLRRLANLVGWLAVLITLALSGPGVVVKASAEPQAAAASGPSCGVAEGKSETAAVRLSQMIERLRAEAAQQADPSDEVIVLDNRGFSYPVAPAPPAPAAPR